MSHRHNNVPDSSKVAKVLEQSLRKRSNAAKEARQLLDEIAGYAPTLSENRFEFAETLQKILRWPFITAWHALKQTDLRLARETLKFLKHPGHFFWFHRISPELAAHHFGTSSTDAMTNHIRRYGAHIAMLILAIVVVVGGGFGSFVSHLRATGDVQYANDLLDSTMLVVGDAREIYANAVAAADSGFVRRVEVMKIEAGENLRSIAAIHNISIDTLLYANNLLDPDARLAIGQRLVVPPISGMLHISNAGDTINTLAQIYEVKPETILTYRFNNLATASVDTPLPALQEIMVPGGKLPLRTRTVMYMVQNDDTLKSIAQKFNLQPDTLLANNDLEAGLVPGQQIRILPLNGVAYTVKEGDSLAGIAGYLGTLAQSIVAFKPNKVAIGMALQKGQVLIVPDGEWPIPAENQESVAPQHAVKVLAAKLAIVRASDVQPASVNSGKSVAAVAPVSKRERAALAAAVTVPAKTAAVVEQAPVQKAAAPAAVQKSAAKVPAGRATGKMMWPMQGIISTYFGEGIWYGTHNGLDVTNRCGTPVVAADGGTVVIAGWDGGYGISVVIDHGGGLKTRYGHFSGLVAAIGQRVSKGQLIGYEGTTGASSGCHVHFEVLVNGAYTNPLRWLP